MFLNLLLPVGLSPLFSFLDPFTANRQIGKLFYFSLTIGERVAFIIREHEWVSIAKHQIDHFKSTLLSELAFRNIQIKELKTEEQHRVKGNKAWKESEILRRLFGLEKDINKRKKLTSNVFKMTININSKKSTIAVTVRSLNVYVSSGFLCKNELWT